MDSSLALSLYLSLGFAMTLLRRSQGMSRQDALFCGLFWLLDLLRRGIELLVRSLVQENTEQIKLRHSGVGRKPDDLTPGPRPAPG